MHQWETQNETVGVLMSVLFSTGVQMFKSERVYVPECAFSKCLCNSPTNILLPARSRKFDTTEQNKRLWCNTRPNIARAPLLLSQMQSDMGISSFAVIRDAQYGFFFFFCIFLTELQKSLWRKINMGFLIFNEIAEAKYKIWYSFQNEWFQPRVTATPGFPHQGLIKASPLFPYITGVHGQCLQRVQLHHMEMAVEEMRRAGSEINKSSSQIIRLWMCRPVSGFADGLRQRQIALIISAGLAFSSHKWIKPWCSQHIYLTSVRL